MLTTNRELLASAVNGKYAIGAFNIHNLESLQAVITAAEEEKSPVIVAVTPSTINYAGLQYITDLVKNAARFTTVPMSIHLDHGKDVDTAVRCLDSGFTSVMIDASHLDFEENIATTSTVVEIAHKREVPVEAELGRLVRVENSSVEEKKAVLTDPQAAREFVDRTNVDSLAVAIGTSHGAYKFAAEPRLDFKRLTEIRDHVQVPLVLHAASGVSFSMVRKATEYGAQLAGAKGVPDESIQKAIALGIAKINIDTDLRLTFTATVREVLSTTPNEFDPRKILGPARDAMKNVVRSKMRLFGSSEKASTRQLK